MRERLGKSQSEMAALLGTHRVTVNRYESGQVTPSRSVLLLLLTHAEGPERLAILDELGLDEADIEGLNPGEVQEGLEKFEEFLKQGGLKAGRPRGDNRGELVDLVKQLIERPDPPDQAVNEILRAWLQFGSGKTSQIFKNAALYIDIELKALGRATQEKKGKGKLGTKQKE